MRNCFLLPMFWPGPILWDVFRVLAATNGITNGPQLGWSHVPRVLSWIFFTDLGPWGHVQNQVYLPGVVAATCCVTCECVFQWKLVPGTPHSVFVAAAVTAHRARWYHWFLMWKLVFYYWHDHQISLSLFTVRMVCPVGFHKVECTGPMLVAY
jgi:hypothetical protein